MRLRKPCEHGRYEQHFTLDLDQPITCPGGEFLSDDALVIEKVDAACPRCGRIFVADDFGVRETVG